MDTDQSQEFNLKIKCYLFAESKELAEKTEERFEFGSVCYGLVWCSVKYEELDESFHEKALQDLQDNEKFFATKYFRSLEEKHGDQMLLFEAEFITHITANSHQEARLWLHNAEHVVEWFGYACFSSEVTDYVCVNNYCT